MSLIKHAHHHFDIDRPGKDSYRHRHAGCTEVMVTSDVRWALMHELRGAPEPRLPELLAKMARVDLVLVEGFKREPHRKFEVHRVANGKPWLYPDDPGIVGIVTDADVETRLPIVHLDDIDAVAHSVTSQSDAISLVNDSFRARKALAPFLMISAASTSTTRRGASMPS